jgi:pantoate--beta-alanine ligase
VIVSIFVNPTQFNQNDDYEIYPRDLTSDAALLAEYQVDYVFAPDAQEIYGENFGTFVFVENLTESLEGASRPGHFRGVATIVTILFNTIRPDYAFFGQKDAQQVAVIKRLTQNLGFDTEIVVGRTVREESGLAMSSRNVRLSEAEKNAAKSIFEGLRAAKIAIREGERSAGRVSEIVCRRIESEPLAKIDYVAVVDSETLLPIDKITDRTVLIAVAVMFGKTRLIDNTTINLRQ